MAVYSEVRSPRKSYVPYYKPHFKFFPLSNKVAIYANRSARFGVEYPAHKFSYAARAVKTTEREWNTARKQSDRRRKKRENDKAMARIKWWKEWDMTRMG